MSAPPKVAPRPVVVVALVTAICLLGDSALYVLLPSRLEAFAVTPTGAGLILGVNRYVRIVSNAIAGWLYGHAGFYGPFVGAVLLAGATTVSYGLIIGFWPLIVAHSLWGISWSFLRLGGYLAVIDSAKGASVGRLMGVLQGVTRGGSLVAVIAGGLLADTMGNRQTFVIFGLITLMAIALVPLGKIPKGLGQRPKPQTALDNESRVSAGQVHVGAWKIRALCAEAGIAWLVIPGLLVGTAGYLVRTVAGGGATVAGLSLGVGTLSGILIGVRYMSDLLLSPFFGHLSDVFGRARIILISLGVIFASLVIIALEQSLVLAVPLFSAAFVSSTALLISLNAAIGELAPPGRRAAVLSRYATWADIGSGTGPLLGLPLVTMAGFGWTYGGAAALIAAAALLYVSAFPGQRRSER